MCTSEYDESGLGDVAEVVVAAVGEVGAFEPELVTGRCPSDLEVEGGVRTVGNELACGLGIAVEDVTTHAVLPTEGPTGGEGLVLRGERRFAAVRRSLAK